MIHVEVQSQPVPDFAKRMFIYHCRFFEVHRRPIVSLAVLADTTRGWRPKDFGYNVWGCDMSFRFPIVKLLDLAADGQALEDSANPFAAVVMAHLATMELPSGDDRRIDAKLKAVRRLYNHGWSAELVRKLFNIVDSMMELPKRLDPEFRRRVQAIELEHKMPYVSSIERLAREEGLEEGLEQGLENGLKRGIAGILKVRFGPQASDLIQKVESIRETKRLEAMFDDIEAVASLEELRRMWNPAN